MTLLTTCTLDCPDRCSILCRVEAGTVRIRGNPDHPYTRGFTCHKIRRYPHRLASPHRIREPWVRDGDRLRPAAWEEAWERVCRGMEEARAADPASVLLVRGAGSMGVSKAFADYVFAALGARSTHGSLCDSAGCAALAADAGRLDMNDPAQIDRAEAVVLWGKNPRACSVHTAAQVAAARRRGRPVLAVNPDPSAVASLADRTIRVRPGSDRFLALACARLFLASGSRPPPWERAANREAFEALLARHPFETLLDRCGVSEADARALAGLYGRTPRVATLVGWGVQRYPRGGENVRAIHALAFLAGTLSVPGGGLYYSIPSSRHLRRPRPARSGASPLSLPALSRELPRAEPPVRFVWFTCSNFLNQGPDAKAAREALAAVDTVVAVEGFWTETAKQATVVLPPALWLEEEDVVGSYWYNVVGAVRRAVDPPGACRPDFEILQELAARFGVEHPFGRLDEWLAACLPETGPALGELRAAGWAALDWPAVPWARGFAHPDGKFALLESVTDEEPSDPLHPFSFLTLVRRDALHSQMLPEEQATPLPVRLHPDTGARLELAPRDAVRLVSSAGELEGEVHFDPLLAPDTVTAPRGGWISLGLGVNEATELHLTDVGEGAAYYATRVRVERATGSPPEAGGPRS
ncbi:MAG: molybdopterin-dependent oxidoreductase [Deferrisomatales bacterium]